MIQKRKPKKDSNIKSKETKKEPIKLDIDGRPILLKPHQREIKNSINKKRWVAPDDMPDYIVLGVLSGNYCGEPIYINGKLESYCCRKPHSDRGLIPIKCEIHGGRVKASKYGKQIVLTSGLYSDALMSEEVAIYPDIRCDDLTDEIKVMKLRLRRALIKELNNDQELEFLQEETSVVDGQEFFKKITKYRNMTATVNKLISHLCQLMAQHQAMQNITSDQTIYGDAVKIYLPNNNRVNLVDELSKEKD